MSKKIIDVKRLLNIVKDKVRDYTKDNQLKLVIMTDHSDPASETYLRSKKKHCEDVNITCEIVDISNMTKEQALAELQSLNMDESVSGIIVQLPCQKDYADTLISQIHYAKDVDGLTAFNKYKLANGSPVTEMLLPCTPQGILWILDSIDFKYDGAYALVCGRSELVGKPLVQLLNMMNCTITLANSHTDYSKINNNNYDLVVSAIGKPNFFNITDQNKDPEVVLIDVGISRNENGKLCGDINLDKSTYKMATKVPGGVGLMTVGSLLYNITKADRIQKGIKEDI